MPESVHDVRTAAQRMLADARRVMHDARERILRGESTGDPISDFMTVHAPLMVLDGSADPIEARYRELAERLKGKTGQFVLMIERELGHPDSSPSFAPPLREGFSLGLLADDKLCFNLRGPLPDDAPSWTFPTERYGKRGDHRFMHGDSGPIRVETGGMHPWCEAVFYTLLDEHLNFQGHAHHGLARFSLGVDSTGPVTRLDLFIGNDEVDAWCRDLNLKTARPSAEVRVSNPINLRRVEMIRQLADAIGVDPKIISAVKAATPTR